ncbi:hypothetical protein C1H69_21800 [Billgrantia endophytica]|uniref:Uncharacterized protein n=2 Tax=Billgrantia endophytica TaxID=2033802 RepID=A0A2N7TVS3_9GAMM|nr:hypothetical protein C1H69_21800 [Halomonas endophytica]
MFCIFLSQEFAAMHYTTKVYLYQGLIRNDDAVRRTVSTTAVTFMMIELHHPYVLMATMALPGAILMPSPPIRPVQHVRQGLFPLLEPVMHHSSEFK